MRPMSSEQPSSRARSRARLVAQIVGYLLLVGAIVVAATQGDSWGEVSDRLRTASPSLVALLAGCVFANLALTGLVFSVLMRPYGRVGLWEMQWLIASSTLLNLLPLKPGLVGRVAYHRSVNGIPIAGSIRTIIEGLALSGLAVSLVLTGQLIAQEWGGGVVWSLAPALVIGLAFAAVPRTRRRGIALLFRIADLVIWAIRYWAVFHIIGQPLQPTAALAMASAAVLASALPLAGNGLGLREWVIGLLAPTLAGCDVSLGVTADLIHRVAELVILAPAGSLATLWVMRRWKRSNASTGSG